MILNSITSKIFTRNLVHIKQTYIINNFECKNNLFKRLNYTT